MKVLSLLHITPKGAGNTYHETPGAVFILTVRGGLDLCSS